MTAGTSFPQNAPLTVEEAAVFFASQTRTACAFDKAEDREQLIGFYLLHPNNVGRCSHIANASYGVTAAARGRGCGHQLVEDSLYWAKRTGFTALQFNAVVSMNEAALRFYRSLGFQILAAGKDGFRMPDGNLADTYICLKQL